MTHIAYGEAEKQIIESSSRDKTGEVSEGQDSTEKDSKANRILGQCSTEQYRTDEDKIRDCPRALIICFLTAS